VKIGMSFGWARALSSVSSCLLYWTAPVPARTERRGQAERAAQVVLEVDFGSRAAGAARREWCRSAG